MDEGLHALDVRQVRTLSVQRGVLVSQRMGGMTSPLPPLGKGRYTFPDQMTDVQIERGADGKVFRDEKNGRLMGQAPGQPAFELKATSVTLTQNGSKLEMPRKD